MTWRNQPLLRTHNLLELVASCAELDDAFLALREAAITLNPYAFEFRYPGTELEPPSDVALEAIQLAQQVFDFVIVRLPDDTRIDKE